MPYDLHGSDLDLLVAPCHIELTKQIIIAIARRHKGFAVWREMNGHCCALFLCVAVTSSNIRWSVHIDIMIDIRRRLIYCLLSEQVLSRVVRDQGICHADDCDSNIIAFFDKVLDRSISCNKYKAKVDSIYSRLSEHAKKLFASNSGREIDFLIGKVNTDDQRMVKNVT